MFIEIVFFVVVLLIPVGVGIYIFNGTRVVVWAFGNQIDQARFANGQKIGSATSEKEMDEIFARYNKKHFVQVQSDSYLGYKYFLTNERMYWDAVRVLWKETNK